jgi:glycine cleavage system aminomethyltransferase T
MGERIRGIDRHAWSSSTVRRPALSFSPLDELLRRTGATMVDHHGAVVASDFGSVPGELAVCQRAVGISDRSELVHLELRGGEAPVRRLVERLTGFAPVADVARSTEHGWWCPVTPHRVLVLSEPDLADSLAGDLGHVRPSTARAAWMDVSSDQEAIAVVGPNAEPLLVAVAPAEDTRALPVTGIRPVRLAGFPALVLREAPMQFLAVVAAAHAAEIWRALQSAGHEHGLGSVGRTALERFAISERMLGRQAG